MNLVEELFALPCSDPTCCVPATEIFYRENEKKRTVVAVIKHALGKVVGKAKCCPEDMFDVEYGRQLARLRAEEKLEKLKVRSALDAVLEYEKFILIEIDPTINKLHKNYLKNIKRLVAKSDQIRKFLNSDGN